MSLLRKLLDLLPGVFEKGPDAVLALRVGVTGGELTWQVADDTLTLTPRGAPAAPLTIALDSLTLAGLADLIAATPGYRVLFRDDSEQALLSATTLVDAAGDSAQSNGDHLYGYANPLWAYLKAVASELAEADGALTEMLRQMVMTQAGGDWLDLWGSYFSVTRNPGEQDAPYAARIIVEVLRPRVNHIAIRNILEEALGTAVTIREPWQETFVLDASELSGSHAIQDGAFWDFCTLEIESDAPAEAIAPLAERNKAAGVRLWYAQRVGLDLADDLPPPPVQLFSTAFSWGPEAIDAQLMLSGHPGWLSGEQVLLPQCESSFDWLLDGRPAGYALAGAFLDWVWSAQGTRYPASAMNPLPFPVYLLEAPGQGSFTEPLLAGGDWLIDDLSARGYAAGASDVSLTPVPFSIVNGFSIDITQLS